MAGAGEAVKSTLQLASRMPQKVLLRSGEWSFKVLDGDYRGVSKCVRQLCGKLSHVPVQSVQGDFILIRLGSVYSLSFDCLSLLESLEVSKFVGQFVRGQSRLLGTRLNQQRWGVQQNHAPHLNLCTNSFRLRWDSFTNQCIEFLQPTNRVVPEINSYRSSSTL